MGLFWKEKNPSYIRGNTVVFSEVQKKRSCAQKKDCLLERKGFQEPTLESFSKWENICLVLIFVNLYENKLVQNSYTFIGAKTHSENHKI